MDPRWVSVLIGVAAGVISAWITVEVRINVIKTQLAERENQRKTERELYQREIEFKFKHQEVLMGILNTEVIRVRDAYHDTRKLAADAWSKINK